METFEIEIEARSSAGSRIGRRSRAVGKVPCVVYGRGLTPTMGAVNEREFVRLAKLARTSQVFTLKSANSSFHGKSALVKEVQKEYVGGRVLHVDFQALRDDEEVMVRVLLRFSGEAPGVKNEGGILAVATHDLAVRCLPKKIPSELSVDVSKLDLGKSIHASAITLPEGVRLAGNPEETLVSVVEVKIVEEAKPAETAAAATAEGAAAAPAEGAAAAPAEGAAAPADAKGGDAKAAKGADAKPAKEKK